MIPTHIYVLKAACYTSPPRVDVHHHFIQHMLLSALLLLLLGGLFGVTSGLASLGVFPTKEEGPQMSTTATPGPGPREDCGTAFKKKQLLGRHLEHHVGSTCYFIKPNGNLYLLGPPPQHLGGVLPLRPV